MQINVSLKVEKRDYNDVAALAGLSPSDLSDCYRKVTLGINDLPFHHFQVAASIFFDILDSNITQSGYRANDKQSNARYESNK